MEIVFDSKGGFTNMEKWLEEVSRRSPNPVLNKIAIEGEESLAANTPIDTGGTASGWKAKITTNNQGISEVAWFNDAHPEANVNVAVIIDQGHGTGTGGFVLPQPYIKRSMDKVFSTAGNKIEEELFK
jgi:hypothetical protein